MKSKVFILFTLLLMSILPVLAQDTNTRTVTINDYSFIYPDSLAANITITTYPGDPLDQPPPSELMGWEARYTQFELSNTDGYRPELILRLAQTADIVGYPEEQGTLAHLQQLLTDRPDLKTFEAGVTGGITNPLPTLPGGGSAQIIIARAEYVETDTFTGIAYLTVYVQDMFPVNKDSCRYVFIGVSKSQLTYVWMEVFLSTDLFPDASTISNSDREQFYLDPAANYVQSIEIVDAAPGSAFTPNLDDIDALIASIHVNEGGE